MADTTNIPMQDKEMMHDALSSEKQMTGLYNTFTNECANTALRDEMMNILHDEHCMQADIFMDMQKRGWYPTPAAEDQKVQSAKEKFTNMNAGN
jgi:spore coat protein CotF